MPSHRRRICTSACRSSRSTSAVSPEVLRLAFLAMSFMRMPFGEVGVNERVVGGPVHVGVVAQVVVHERHDGPTRRTTVERPGSH